ncbi:MAG: TolC family protein [Oligoflexia bacterium]|nr:TolC family protein [Oligoflexia bacterium]
MALENSQALHALESEYLVTTYKEKNNFSSLLPKLALQTTHGYQDEFHHKSNVHNWVSNFSLQLSEKFYDNGVTFIAIRNASLSQKISEKKIILEKNKLCYNLLQQYLDYSYLAQTLLIEEESLALLKKQFSHTSTLYQQGLKTKLDYLRLKGELQKTEIGLLSLKSAIAKSKLDLATSLNPQELLHQEFTPLTIPTSVKKMIFPTFSSKQSLQYQQGAIAQEVHENNVILARKKLRPEFYLDATSTYSTKDYLGEHRNGSFRHNESLDWSILLTVKFTLWDWGISQREHKIAVEEKYQQSTQLTQELSDLARDLEKMRVQYEQIFQQYKLNYDLYKLEEDNFSNLYDDYRNGRVSYLDMITALRTKTATKKEFYSSITELQKTIASIYYYQGILYDKVVKDNSTATLFY